jgi:extracellular elastinolytic metalloproteinase
MKRSLPKPALVAICLLAISATSVAQKEEALLNIVRKTNSVLHISAADAKQLTLSSSFADPSGIEYGYLQQSYQGLPVFNKIISVAVKNGRIAYYSGKFVGDIGQKAGSAVPLVQPDVAIRKAATHLQLPNPFNLQQTSDRFASEKKYNYSDGGIARREIEVSLMWVPTANDSRVQLAWNVNIDVAGSSDWWNVRVDAQSGEIISKDNWTVYENNPVNELKMPSPKIHGGQFEKREQLWSPPNVTTGAYNVVPMPFESRNHGSISIENQPWLKAGATNSAVTNGWHFDGTNNYDITRGNNVHAYLDLNNSNAPSASNTSAVSSTVAPGLSFTVTPNFTLQPSDPVNRAFAITNLFYWNNLVHDVMYQYGFTEAAGNFQNDNLGRGGSGSDYVRAEGQDGGGTNNANFSTPVDGTGGRMQMYLFKSSIVTVQVNSPASIAAGYTAVEGAMSTANMLTTAVTGNVIFYNDNASGTTHDACTPAANPAALAGKIALINRNTCNFTVKVKNAQNAGAIAVLVVNNIPGAPGVMGGADNTITIPAVMISQSDGALIAAQLANNIAVNATIKPPVSFDGDLDNGVVTHEYGHGISTRLTGGRLNSSCLTNAEQGGEGWSDYFALMMTTNWATAQLTDGTISRPMGTYVEGQPVNGSGIRNFPYTTNMSVNPHTYSDLASNPEVHFIGEVWCSALWDMTWNIIQQEGAIESNIYNSAAVNKGNTIALRLVMEGLKLQPCLPGFLDARDAILAADSILYNNRHKCSIWNAFARRGMGFSAVQGSSGSATDQIAAFNIPSSITLTRSGAPVKLNSGQQQTFTVGATCDCQPLTGYTIRDTIPAGFTYVSSTGGILNGNVVSFSSLNFAAQETKNFTLTVTASGTGCPVDTTFNDNRDNNTSGGLTSITASGAGTWTVSSLHSRSGSAWFASDIATAADFSLVTNPFFVGSLSVFSFWHYLDTETGFDGGKIEISTNGGTTWIDAAPYVIQRTYNTTMVDVPWGVGEKTFSGSTGGNFINTVLNLSSFVTQTVRLRFHMKTDIGNPGTLEGWFVDDVMQLNGCGGVLKAGVYNASNQLADVISMPVFINGNGIPTSVTTVNPDGISYFIAPNPASGQAVLHFSKPLNQPEISIYDVAGKLVQQNRPGSTVSEYVVPTDQLSNGIYIITIHSKNLVVNTKLVVSH